MLDPLVRGLAGLGQIEHTRVEGLLREGGKKGIRPFLRFALASFDGRRRRELALREQRRYAKALCGVQPQVVGQAVEPPLRPVGSPFVGRPTTS